MKNLIFLGCVFVLGCSTTKNSDELYVRDPSYRCSTVDNCAEIISKNVSNTFYKQFTDANEFQRICQQYPDSNDAIIRIFIDRNGNIESFNLLKSNEAFEFNEKAIEAVKSTAPFFEVRGVSEDVFIEAKEIYFNFVCDMPPT